MELWSPVAAPAGMSARWLLSRNYAATASGVRTARTLPGWSNRQHRAGNHRARRACFYAVARAARANPAQTVSSIARLLGAAPGAGYIREFAPQVLATGGYVSARWCWLRAVSAPVLIRCPTWSWDGCALPGAHPAARDSIIPKWLASLTRTRCW